MFNEIKIKNTSVGELQSQLNNNMYNNMVYVKPVNKDLKGQNNAPKKNLDDLFDILDDFSITNIPSNSQTNNAVDPIKSEVSQNQLDTLMSANLTDKKKDDLENVNDDDFNFVEEDGEHTQETNNNNLPSNSNIVQNVDLKNLNFDSTISNSVQQSSNLGSVNNSINIANLNLGHNNLQLSNRRNSLNANKNQITGEIEPNNDPKNPPIDTTPKIVDLNTLLNDLVFDVPLQANYTNNKQEDNKKPPQQAEILKKESNIEVNDDDFQFCEEEEDHKEQELVNNKKTILNVPIDSVAQPDLGIMTDIIFETEPIKDSATNVDVPTHNKNNDNNNDGNNLFYLFLILSDRI